MWFTSLFGAQRLASAGARAERVHRCASKRSAYRKHRSGQLIIDALEDRLCPSIDLLVSSSYDAGVMRYNGATGAFLGAFVPPGYGDLYSPHGLLIGADGNLLASSAGSNEVLRYNSTTGAFMGALVPAGSGGLDGSVGIVLGLDGNLLVSSAQTHSIKRYDATTGAFLGDFVSPNSGGLNRPHGLIFGPDSNLYVMSADDDNVMRFDGTTGAPLPAPGRSGAIFVDPGTLLNAWGELAFGPDGNLYVSNWGGNNVLRIDAATGNSLGEYVPAGDHGLSQSHGLVFGPDDNLYVVSQGTNNVLRYDGTSGSFIDVFVPPVHLNAPTYLTFWDTGSDFPIGGGGTNHHSAVSASHGPHPSVFSNVFAIVAKSAPPGSEAVLRRVYAFPESRPLISWTPSQEIWQSTAGSFASSIQVGFRSIPVSSSLARGFEDKFFAEWATQNSHLERLDLFGASGEDLLGFTLVGGL